MKKIVPYFAVAIVLVFALSACSAQYSEEDFLGKTSAEIVAEFGAFDCVTMPASDDGLYRNCLCGYTQKNDLQCLNAPKRSSGAKMHQDTLVLKFVLLFK